MNYLALYNYTKDIVTNIEPDAKWFHGRKDLVTAMSPDDIVVFCLPFISSGGIVPGGGQVAETWEVNIIFYKKDSLPSGLNQNDESGLQTEINILRQTNELADSFLRNFNYNIFTEALESASEKLDLVSFNKSNAIKDTAHVLTGTVLSMRVQVPDDFDYCVI